MSRRQFIQWLYFTVFTNQLLRPGAIIVYGDTKRKDIEQNNGRNIYARQIRSQNQIINDTINILSKTKECFLITETPIHTHLHTTRSRAHTRKHPHIHRTYINSMAEIQILGAKTTESQFHLLSIKTKRNVPALLYKDNQFMKVKGRL